MEPSSKRQLMIAGLIIVVLVVLFVVAAVHDPDKGSGPGCSPETVQAWRARVLRPEPVAPGQLGGCTTALGPFVIPGSCALKIAAADARARSLVVEAIDKIRISFVTDADGRKLTMNAELDPGKHTEISIGKDGQRIVFVCRNGNPTCQAKLR